MTGCRPSPPRCGGQGCRACGLPSPRCRSKRIREDEQPSRGCLERETRSMLTDGRQARRPGRGRTAGLASPSPDRCRPAAAARAVSSAVRRSPWPYPQVELAKGGGRAGSTAFEGDGRSVGSSLRPLPSDHLPTPLARADKQRHDIAASCEPAQARRPRHVGCVANSHVRWSSG
jgi:hypothetical protein